jgi:hypothetical protein
VSAFAVAAVTRLDAVADAHAAEDPDSLLAPDEKDSKV